jgi:hypothetical protein
MARKGVKRTLANANSSVAKKCKTIAAIVRNAEDVPKPVRSMLCDTIVRTFGTYKEERHAFQNTASALIGNILKASQGKLQTVIKEAQEKKGVLDNEAATLSAANDAATAASAAAAQALADTKTAVVTGKTALKDAKTALHDLETEGKSAEAESVALAAKKGKLEELGSTFIPAVKEGTQHGAAAGRHVGKDLGNTVDPEFLACVTRTFSKPSSSWGTFDNIVHQRLEESLKKIISGLTSDISAMATAKETRTSSIEATKAGITAAEENAKTMEEACSNAATAAKDAEAAAEAATTAFKQQQQQVQKAADVCTNAEDALTSFTNGPLAAYTDVEARVAPPPPAAPVAEAMAPAPEVRPTPTVAASPGVMGMVSAGVRNLLPSPRLASTPQIASTPPVASSPRNA